MRTGNRWLWPITGLVGGLALLNKPLIAFLVAGLLAGVAIAGARGLLRSCWVWAGVLIALAVWSPWLAWQTAHGWPQLEVSGAIAAGGSVSSQPRWALLPFQLLLVSPLLAPVWIAGLIRLFRDPGVRRFRFLAWAWVVLAATFIATAGKPYYLGGLLPVLIAAGATPVDRWLERGRQKVRRVALVGAVVVSAIVGGAIALPILPVECVEPVVAVNPDVGETIGWPELAETVAEVHRDLPTADRSVILTRNYGEARAIDRYGPPLGLPPAYSGHNGYWELGAASGYPGPGDRRRPVGSRDPRPLLGLSARGEDREPRCGRQRGSRRARVGVRPAHRRTGAPCGRLQRLG